ncbi:hypothetical protein [Polynucleobacter sp. MWH-HuK1]|uniref:hypothetical protein n=1 Tax=Polynucleobacter sp. MWH-HuK1 TaxID=1743158 RepID=UPI001C0D8755|nr:hypothetical protein [Polynucleobacter sp. MWH-HuK1]MBU3565258.1 hypothetical protein [Polynucleobacter sp. MWH-HuK1]
MKQIKITGRSVIKLAILSFSVFIVIGIGIHFLGFRVAIRFSPEMTKEMGGVITRKEFDEIEAMYREKLQILERQLPAIESKIATLSVLKNQFSELATPTPIKSKPQNNEN